MRRQIRLPVALSSRAAWSIGVRPLIDCGRRGPTGPFVDPTRRLLRLVRRGPFHYSRLRNWSRSRPQSRRILLINPGPIVSPACAATTVVRPSGCRRKWWLLRTRTTSRPPGSKPGSVPLRSAPVTCCSCRDPHPLDPDKLQPFGRLGLDLQAQGNRLPHPVH